MKNQLNRRKKSLMMKNRKNKEDINLIIEKLNKNPLSFGSNSKKPKSKKTNIET